MGKYKQIFPNEKYVLWLLRIVGFCVDGLRLGQSYMNGLRTVDDEYYDAITGTELDCFYDDSKCGAFLEALKKHWEE